MGGWRRLHNEELHNLDASLNIKVTKSSRWAWNVACMGQTRNVYKILVRKPEGKRPHERPGRRWKHKIIIHLRDR
jgi:hypothetical protein